MGRVSRKLDGYVTVAPEEVLSLIAAKRARLDSTEEALHKKRVDDILKYQNRPRRYFWRPWKFKPPITREQAESLYATPDDWGYSSRQWTESGYNASRSRLIELEGIARDESAKYSQGIMLSLRTLSWLRGDGHEDA
jgi:hypothetical protein